MGDGLPPGGQLPVPSAQAHLRLPADRLDLNLLDGEQPSHAAILLFGAAPQRFLPTSEVKCLHFHGTEVRKPIPSYQIYKGAVFELVDQAVDFVLSKLVRAVGTRAAGTEAPVTYELPREAVAEAIVNAVAHRDYASNASVQVMLFADRLEVWNPGELPPPPILAAAADAPAVPTFAVAPQPPAPAVLPPIQAAPPAPPPLTAARFDADYLHNPVPVYPSFSRRLGEEGKVQLRVRVSAEGAALEVEVKQSSGFPRLDAAARDAVLKWRFVAARRGSEAVESWVGVPIVFKLEQ